MLSLLRIFRKTFLTKYARVYYSQFGEDVVLRELVGKKSDGVYVDVGCYHPKRYSNTYWLYKRGWRGINIDMEEEKIAMFRLARPDDVNILAAISDEIHPYYLYATGSNDLGAHLSRERRPDGISITTRTLTQVIDATRYLDMHIDLLTVDAEDHDLEVLQSLDWQRYRPSWVIAETRDKNLRDVIASPINRFLEERGYSVRSWTVSSLIFTRKEA